MSIPFGKDDDLSSVFKPGSPCKPVSVCNWVGIYPLAPGEARWSKALTSDEVLALQAGADPRTVAPDYLYAYRPFNPELGEQMWKIKS